MTVKARRRIGIAAAITGLVAVSFWIVTHPRHHDPYPFLKDQPLLDVAVRGPGSFGPKEFRLYSWHEPFERVKLAAKTDLPHYGLKRRKFKNDKSKNADWSGDIVDGGPCGVSSDIWITISPGNNPSIQGLMKKSDDNPEWTTVVVSSDLDESWVNVLRYTFFSLHY